MRRSVGLVILVILSGGPALAQQPLDIGLFEVRAPEDPDRVIADE